MSGDIAFEKEIQRTISVDIRYIMFVIDKLAGANHLINEMTIAPRHNDKIAINEDVLDTNKIDSNDIGPDSLVKGLETKEYLGVLLPVFDMNSFSSAFNMAVSQYGSSKEQRFWWNGNVYTTERVSIQNQGKWLKTGN